MSVMKLEYAEDIYDIPFEEDQNGLFHPKFTNYGRAQMTPLERKAVDLMNELDPTALDMVNISGLYLRIWKEIGKKAEKARNSTARSLLAKTSLSRDYSESVSQTELISSGQRGMALMKVGRQAAKVRFVLSDERLEMFGRGGGR